MNARIKSIDRYWLPAPRQDGYGFFVRKLVKHPTTDEPHGLADFENNFDLSRRAEA